MEETDASSYLRLSQFLDLEGHWSGASSCADFCHRICRAAAVLLDAPGVAIALGPAGEHYDIIASDGNEQERAGDEATRAGLLSAARMARTRQLKSRGDDCLGVFPFAVNDATDGCLCVRLPRPLFREVEISFLRFVASLAGLVIRAWTTPRRSASTEPSHEPDALCNGSPWGRETAEAPAESAARRYVAMAVHDLRNPLNVVAGYTALLDEESLGALTAQQREAVEAIKRQTHVLLSSVDQLIELDCLRKAPVHLPVSRFELGKFFDELRATCFAHCAGRVRWPEPGDTSDFTCDRRRLFSIAQNLIDNALKHTQSGEIVVDCVRSNGNLVLSVRDQGPGFDPELRSALITHARSGTETAPRSGLGLYTLASHVHALGGAVDIQSGQFGGTHIVVKIPDGSTTDEAAAPESLTANGSRTAG